MRKIKLNIQKFASSGVVYTGYTENSRFYVTWEQSSQDISNNQTTITWRLYAELGHNFYSNAVRVDYVNIDGSTVKTSQTYSNLYRGTHELASGTKTITHNADGTRTFNINLSGWVIDGTTVTGNQNFELNTILRQAKITSAPDFNDEQNPTIQYSNPAGNVVSSLQARIENSTGTSAYIQYRDISKTGTSYTFNFTNEERETLRNLTPNNNKLTVKFVIKTVIGGTTLWSTVNRTMTIVNGNPIFSDFEFEDINPTTVALTGDNTVNINGYSNIQVTIPVADKATAVKSATMSKYQFTITKPDTQPQIEDIAYSSSEVVSGTITGALLGTYKVYAIDSRGNSTPVEKTATNSIIYEPISFNTSSCKVKRNNGGVGAYAELTLLGNIWNGNFGQVSNSIKSIYYEYKKTSEGASDWRRGPTTITPTISGNNFSVTNLEISSAETDGKFELQTSYNFRIYIEDELSTVIFTDISPMASAVPNISFADDGVGIMCDYDENLGGSLQVGGIRPTIIIAKELYDSGGSNGDITMSEDVRNYDYVEVYFYTNDNVYDSGKFKTYTTMKIGLQSQYPTGQGSVYFKSKVLTLTNNGLKFAVTNYAEVAEPGGAVTGNNIIYIYKIIGYKYI